MTTKQRAYLKSLAMKMGKRDEPSARNLWQICL